jgi:hypothetical protein
MLEDGRDSIYSPDHGFYRMLRMLAEVRGSSGATAREMTVGTIADADGAGACFGALHGLVLGALGEASFMTVGMIAGSSTEVMATVGGYIGDYILGPSLMDLAEAAEAHLGKK